MASLRDKSQGVRVRTTATAVAVVAVVLVVAALAIVILLRRSLTADVRTSALLRAETVAADFLQGRDGALSAGGVEDEFVQVIDNDGEVVASSANVAGEPALAALSSGQTTRIDDVPFEDDPFLAVATSARWENGPVTVVVGRTLETVTEPTGTLTTLLIPGIPLVLVFVGAVTWRLSGRALAPVEAIRKEVDAISSSELHRRVPDPASTDEVARLATTMNRMLARLEEGQARQRRFVSDASHELKSPIASIRQHAEVALSRPDGTDSRELAEVVLEEEARLQRVVEDLLLLAKIDEGKVRTTAEAVDLDDILLQEAARLRTSTSLEIDSRQVSAGRVSGDKRHLTTLVRNLVDNAARHARSAVAFSLRSADGEVVLTVEDDGEGIPPAERKRVFERFVRLDEARARDSGGAGLGLSIVVEVASVHRAGVAVHESRLGGACLEVRFPAPG